MSGASGLSAAKRRRAGSNISFDNNSSNNNNNQGNNGNNQRLRIQDIIIDHERRIQDFEKQFTDNENISMNNSDNEYNAKINTRLDEIENKLVPDVDDKENIEYYKKKIKTMEEQISELKKTMMSIQNIAMDTSTSLMEYKNSVPKAN